MKITIKTPLIEFDYESDSKDDKGNQVTCPYEVTQLAMDIHKKCQTSKCGFNE